MTMMVTTVRAMNPKKTKKWEMDRLWSVSQVVNRSWFTTLRSTAPRLAITPFTGLGSGPQTVDSFKPLANLQTPTTAARRERRQKNPKKEFNSQWGYMGIKE